MRERSKGRRRSVKQFGHAEASDGTNPLQVAHFKEAIGIRLSKGYASRVGWGKQCVLIVVERKLHENKSICDRNDDPFTADRACRTFYSMTIMP